MLRPRAEGNRIEHLKALGVHELQLAGRHADPRTTTVYDHRRQNFDKHPAYVVVAFVTGG
jgi:hypothetical protein